MYRSDPAAARRALESAPEPERVVLIEALTHAYPGETGALCPLLADRAARAYCERTNERPHLRTEPPESVASSERARPGGGPPSDRMPVPPELPVSWDRGSAPACETSACRSAAAEVAAAADRWGEVRAACEGNPDEKWRQDCYFQAAEAAIRARGAAAYPEAARSCQFAGPYHAPCHGHLLNVLRRAPDEALPAMRALWQEHPAFLENAVDLYWTEHAMAVFDGSATASADPAADRYFRTERALVASGAGARVRSLWARDAEGEETLPAMRFRTGGRRTWSADAEVDTRICAIEAEGASARPNARVFARAASDPDVQVRWTAVRLLAHFSPDAPELRAAAADPDERVARAAKSASKR